MALVSVNPFKGQPKESTLDKILKGVTLGAGLVGITKDVTEMFKTDPAEDKSLQQGALLVNATKAGFRRPGLVELPEGMFGPQEMEKGTETIPGLAGTFVYDPQEDPLKTLQAMELRDKTAPMTASERKLFKSVLGEEASEGMKRGEGFGMIKARLGKPETLSPFEKKTQETEATELTKQLADLPAARKRIDNMDTAFKLLETVETGPVAGSDVVAYFRKVVGEKGFQELDAALNEEALKTVQDFAAKAGARAIDTEKERQFLLSTVPGINRDNEVNRSLLLARKALVAGGIIETRAKKDWLDSGKRSLDGYQSPLEGKAAYFQPKTYRIEFYVPGTEPEGWASLAQRLEANPKEGSIADGSVFD